MADTVPELNLAVTLHPNFGFGPVGVGWPSPTFYRIVSRQQDAASVDVLGMCLNDFTAPPSHITCALQLVS